MAIELGTAPGAITRISTTADEAQADALSAYPVFSPDGTLIAFESNASNLVPGDTNGLTDIFVKNLVTGAVTRISTTEAGEQSIGVPGVGGALVGASNRPVFSPDGTSVAFVSAAGNLTGSSRELLVKNLATGAITVVSSSAAGVGSNVGAIDYVFSPDGSRIAFVTTVSNLLPGITISRSQVYIKDLATGALTLASADATGAPASSTTALSSFAAGTPNFSPDGTRIAFTTDAPNIVPNGGGRSHVVVKDLATGAITLVSADDAGAPLTAPARAPVFSPDGTHIVFETYARIYLKNLITGALTIVSTSAAGIEGNGLPSHPFFSPDGTRIAFFSGSTNLIPGDTRPGLFIKTLATGELINVASFAMQAPTVFAPDGAAIAFWSATANLVPGDTNAVHDVFVQAIATATHAIAPAAAAQAEDLAAFTFTVTRAGVTTGPSTVNWSVAGTGPNPANAADFPGAALPSGTISFAPGQTSQTLTIPIAADTDPEPDETFAVTLSNPGDGSDLTITTAPATIGNDDAIPPDAQLAIAATSASKPEGTGGTTAFTFTVTRTGNTLIPAIADWSLRGTGLRPANADDFAGGTLPAGTISFAPLETSRLLTIPVAADTTVETHEEFEVVLAAASPETTIATATAPGSIAPDDAIADLALSSSDGIPESLAFHPRPTFYQGPVAGLEKQWILNLPVNYVIAAAGPNWFIRTRGGNDAIAVSSGTNVLDGGTGSNFLTGGSGPDTFFVDARSPPTTIWSTVVGFGAGDAATVWGIDPATAILQWFEDQGAPGFTGLTLHATTPGAPTASLTLAGYTMDDLGSGAVAINFGFEPGSASNYMYVSKQEVLF
jgi:Tol biopolymer transport system component